MHSGLKIFIILWSLMVSVGQNSRMVLLWVQVSYEAAVQVAEAAISWGDICSSHFSFGSQQNCMFLWRSYGTAFKEGVSPVTQIVG